MSNIFPRACPASRARQGFTLIELLVVIAIIAILAAILFPVFAKAREKARQTACLSNEKQLGLGFMQYAQDFDETLPPQNYGNNNAGTAHWMDIVYPYVKSAPMFSCPDGTADPVFTPCANLDDCSARSGYRFGSYAANSAYYGGYADAAKKVPALSPFEPVGTGLPGVTPLSKIVVPATTIAACETSYNMAGYKTATVSWGNGVVPTYVATTSPPTINAGANSQAVVQHSGGMNAVWCDGHAKWMTGASLVDTHTVGTVPVAYYWTVQDD